MLWNFIKKMPFRNCCSVSTSRVLVNPFNKMPPLDISSIIGNCWLFTMLQIGFLLFSKFGMQVTFVILIRSYLQTDQFWYDLHFFNSLNISSFDLIMVFDWRSVAMLLFLFTASKRVVPYACSLAIGILIM